MAEETLKINNFKIFNFHFNIYLGDKSSLKIKKMFFSVSSFSHVVSI